MTKRLPILTLLTAALFAWLPGVSVSADQVASSGLGNVVVPQPALPQGATECVEPVDVMRREHMNFLMHQRDATVLDGERDSKHSLTGCMDCHNPTPQSGEPVRYPDPRHFCADCHRFASVRIDCFECHADRGLSTSQQSLLSSDALSSHSFHRKLEMPGED